MKKYISFMISILFIATLFLYAVGGVLPVIGTYIGAFIGILLIVFCFILVKGIVFICDLFD